MRALSWVSDGQFLIEEACSLLSFHKVINPIREDFTLIATYLPKAPPLIIITLEVKISKHECGDAAFSLKNITQSPSASVLPKHRLSRAYRMTAVYSHQLLLLESCTPNHTQPDESSVALVTKL